MSPTNPEHMGFSMRLFKKEIEKMKHEDTMVPLIGSNGFQKAPSAALLGKLYQLMGAYNTFIYQVKNEVGRELNEVEVTRIADAMCDSFDDRNMVTAEDAIKSLGFYNIESKEIPQLSSDPQKEADSYEGKHPETFLEKSLTADMITLDPQIVPDFEKCTIFPTGSFVDIHCLDGEFLEKQKVEVVIWNICVSRVATKITQDQQSIKIQGVGNRCVKRVDIAAFHLAIIMRMGHPLRDAEEILVNAIERCENYTVHRKKSWR